jgi:YVTN family beta-propeller protein
MWDLVMDPTAQTLYVTDRGSDQVHVFSADPLTLTTSIAVGDDPWGIDITPDGRLLFVTNEDSSNVSVIDTALNVVTSTIPLAGAAPRDVDISADGAYAYVPSGSITGDDGVYVIDTQAWEVVDTIYVAPASNPNVIAIAPLLANLDPVASFYSNSPIMLGKTAVFTDTSLGTPSWWQWDFGDELGSSSEQNPVYTYADAGTYTVTLTAGNDCGSDQVAGTFVVEPGTLIYVPAIIKND